MKRAILIAIATIGTAFGGDYWRQQQRSDDFNRQQAEWQAEFDRRHYEFEQERIQRANEERMQEIEDQINRSRSRYDFDFDFE